MLSRKIILSWKPLKIPALLLENGVARKPLPSEKLLVVRVVEVFDDTVTPRLPDRDKDRVDAIGKTEPNDLPERAGIPVAAPEVQGVVQLKIIRNSHCLPAA